MANIPSTEEVEKLKLQTQKEFEDKLESQKQLGKDFVLTGAGVIPEEVWKNLPGKQNG